MRTKGIDALMAGASLERAASLAGRVSGDSTVAYAMAFAQAVENALGAPVPPRAVWLRALAGELERLANHLGDIGAVCNDASFSIMHAPVRPAARARAARGRRLLRPSLDDGRASFPAACAATSAGDGAARALAAARLHPPALSRAGRPLRRHRLAQGPHRRHRNPLARAGAAVRRRRLCRARVGPPLRRAARRRATRPTASCEFEVPSVQAGDVNARVWIRIREVEQSLALIEQILAGLPSGATTRAPTARGTAKASRWSKVSAATSSRGSARPRRPHRALPPARSVMVPVAAARGGDRGQHRRRLPALQQILQLLLFGP